ncbi:hypothetical protein DSECCO2_319050 [anaerobic digester metagenome]
MVPKASHLLIIVFWALGKKKFLLSTVWVWIFLIPKILLRATSVPLPGPGKKQKKAPLFGRVPIGLSLTLRKQAGKQQSVVLSFWALVL